MQITFKTITIVQDGKKTKEIEKIQAFDMSFFSGPFEMVDDFDEMAALWSGEELQHNTIGLIVDAKEDVIEGVEHWAGLSIRIHGRHRTILPEDDWLIVKRVYLNEDGTINVIQLDTGVMNLFISPVQQ